MKPTPELNSTNEQCANEFVCVCVQEGRPSAGGGVGEGGQTAVCSASERDG